MERKFNIAINFYTKIRKIRNEVNFDENVKNEYSKCFTDGSNKEKIQKQTFP